MHVLACKPAFAGFPQYLSLKNLTEKPGLLMMIMMTMIDDDDDNDEDNYNDGGGGGGAW